VPTATTSQRMYGTSQAITRGSLPPFAPAIQ
jgi:hypothetical protein